MKLVIMLVGVATVLLGLLALAGGREGSPLAANAGSYGLFAALGLVLFILLAARQSRKDNEALVREHRRE